MLEFAGNGGRSGARQRNERWAGLKARTKGSGRGLAF